MTPFFAWLEQHRLPGELDSEFARRLGISRNHILIWKRGATPQLQTFKDIYYALKLPRDEDSFWNTLRDVLGSMLKDPLPRKYRLLPKDHICRKIAEIISRDDMPGFLSAIKITRDQWDKWVDDPFLDIPFKQHSEILAKAKVWSGK